MKSTENNMIKWLTDMLWRAVEKLYALPGDVFDIDDDENDIIEE